MKVNVNNKIALYPMPLIVVGANNNDKPTWTLVGHTGIIGHDRILVSLFNKHFINKVIKKEKKISLNIVSDNIINEADYCGIVSGEKKDKSEVFKYSVSENNIPLIEDSKLVMECIVEEVIEMNGFDNFICSVIATKVEESCLTDNKIDYLKVSPILFDMPNYNYYNIGNSIGKGTQFGKKI